MSNTYTGTIDNQGHIVLEQPASQIKPGRVRVTIEALETIRDYAVPKTTLEEIIGLWAYRDDVMDGPEAARMIRERNQRTSVMQL